VLALEVTNVSFKEDVKKKKLFVWMISSFPEANKLKNFPFAKEKANRKIKFQQNF